MLQNRKRIRENSKPLYSYRMFVILDGISKGLSRQLICNKLKVKESTLSYHIANLKQNNLIEQTESYPISSYQLTSFGKQIREILIQSENTHQISKKPLWKCHNLIVGWDIKRWGNFKFNEKLWIEMNNWHYQKLKIDGINVNIQDTGLIKIYCPAEYSDNPATTWANMYQKAQQIANHIASRHFMEITPLKVIREGQKSLVGSGQIGELLGHSKVGKVWIDASDGDRELEAAQSDYSLEKLLSLPTILNTELKPVLVQLTEQIRLHLEVMTEMKESMKEMKETMKDIRSGLNGNLP